MVGNNQHKDDASEVKEDVYDGGVAPGNIGLVDFVGNGNDKSYQAWNYIVYRVS